MKRVGLDWRYFSLISLPAINPRAKAYEPYIEKLNFYRSFLVALGAEDRYEDVALDLYNALISGERIRERDYKRIVDTLEWEIEKILTEIIMELRSSGEEEEADFLEKYMEDRDFHMLYRSIMDDIEKKWERISLYVDILRFFDSMDTFNKVAGNIYRDLKSKKWVNVLEFAKADNLLEAEIRKRIYGRIKELRDSGYGREADKVEDYLKAGDLDNAYHALLGIREIKKVETTEVNTKQFMSSYLDAYTLIEALHRAGVDVDDVKWHIGEILGINTLKVPEERVTLIDDPTGNAACFIAIYLRRIGADFTFFSTSGIGNYWITNIDVDGRISPTLQASKLGESAISSKGIVLIEDINYLINSNKFSEVYRFLYYLKNNVEDRIIATVNLNTLSEREKARLKGIADKVIKFDFPLNICTLNMVAVENRPEDGALLLSKERDEEFKGKTYIITDFGGENTLHPQRIDFEIIDKIAENIDDGDVIIDALDMLIDENGLDKIYIWLKFVRDIAMSRGKRVYIVTRDLVANERTYIRPLVDLDAFQVVNMDKKKLLFLQKEMKTILRILEKRVEKECVYTLEMIKYSYQKYKKYLSSLDEDIKAVSNLQTYDLDCILKIAPLRKEIETRVEDIENITSEFNEVAERINSQIPVLKVYVDTSAIEKDIEESRTLVNSGDYMDGIQKIKDTEASLSRLYRSAVSRAWSLREEVQCVDYLLPPYHKEKILEFEGDREKLKDFTLLYMAVKSLIYRKIENEYNKLKNYASVSGIELFDLGDLVKEEKYCEYRKLRDDFLFKFDKVKDEIFTSLKEKTISAMKLLEERGYDIHNIGESIESANDIDVIMDIWSRLSHHLIRYVENYISTLRDRCPRCVNEEVGRYIERFRKDPMSNVESLGEFLTQMDAQAEKEEQELRDITRELENYYRILDKLEVNYQKKYPRRIEDARDVLNYVRVMLDSLTPNIEVRVDNWSVDETKTMKMEIVLKNPDKYAAKNITLEIHGALSYNAKIPEIAGESEAPIQVSSEVRDPNSIINIDIVYEGPGGNITTKSYQFDINIKGYDLTKAEGTEKCALCRGKIFKDTDMVTCAKCGATYHLQCAKRVGRCRICGTVFLLD